MIEKGVQRAISFTMRDSATGQPKTTLNAVDITVRVSKDGGAFAATINAPVATQDGGVNTGEFSLILTAAEMTADAIVIKATAAGCIEARPKIITEANYTAARAGYLSGAVALDSTGAKEANIESHVTASLSAYSTGGGANQVTLKTQLADMTPIPDAAIQVFNSTQTVLVTFGSTNTLGEKAFALNNGTYRIRISKAGYSFTVPETIAVSGNGTFAFTGAGSQINLRDL